MYTGNDQSNNSYSNFGLYLEDEIVYYCVLTGRCG